MPKQANGSDKKLGYVFETVAGVTPATPSFKELPHVSFTLGSQFDKLKSKTLRSNRTPAPSRRGNATVSGNLVVEGQPDTYDDFLKMALMSEWVGNNLHIGKALYTVAVEEGYDFGDNVQHRVFNGVCANTMAMTVNTTEQVQWTFGLMGLTESDFSPTSADANGYTPVTLKDFFWHVDGSFREDGDPIGYLSSISLDLNNNIVGNRALGTDSYRNVTEGEASVSGKVTGLLESVELFNKLKNNITTSFSYTLRSGQQTLTFTLNGVKLSNGTITSQSNAGVTFDFDYEASGDNALVITRA